MFKLIACWFVLHMSIGGSVVEWSPATRPTRVRFPANALFFIYETLILLFLVYSEVNDVEVKILMINH